MSSTSSVRKSAKVYFRIIPQPNMSWDYVKISKCGTKIRVRNLQDFNIKQGLEKKRMNYRTYYADGVFFNESQYSVYEIVIENVLTSVFNGMNAIIMAYGQTGTGKTLTISGLESNYEDRGLAPRIISDIFRHKESQGRSISTSICMSYIEIHKSGITDLLKPIPNCLDINSLKHVSVVEIKNEDDGLKWLFIAEARKQYIRDPQYPSNLATNILSFIITKKNISVVNSVKKVSKIHIIDFAGVDKAGNYSCLHREVLDIGKANVLKSQLEQFVMILSSDDPEKIKVKQRLNILIQYLGKCLSSRSVLRAIGHITPHFEDLMITHSMLRFGHLLLGIKTHKREVEDDELTALESSLRELEALKHEKIYEAIFMNKNLSMNIDQDRLAHLKGVVEEYVQDKNNTITVLNVSDANVILKVFKDFTKDILEKSERARKDEYDRGYYEASLELKYKRQSKTDKSDSVKVSSPSLQRKYSSTNDFSPTKKKESSKQLDVYSSEAVLRKKSKSGSGIIAKKSSSKHRTISETVILEKAEEKSKTSLSGLVLPDMIPQYQEIWDDFVRDENSDYNRLTEVIKENERVARQVQHTYLKEVTKLQTLMEFSDIRKDELLQAKMIRKYTEKGQENADGSEILNENERICLENKLAAEEKVRDQQEVVLRYQAELREFIKQRGELKRQLQDSFDDYCKASGNLPVPFTDQETKDFVEDLLSKIDEDHDEEQEEKWLHDVSIAKEETDKMKYEKFREYMFRERRKIELYKIKSRSWVTQ